MKKFYLAAACCAFVYLSFSQTPVSSYTITNDVVNTVSNHSNQGWTIGSDYQTTTTYTNTYAQTNSGGSGLERRVTGFTIGATSYSPVPRPGGLPFDQVLINRHPAVSGDTINTLYEYTASTGNNLYYAPRYVGTLDGVINSFVCNRGSDNTFSNSPSTQANIERIDLLINSGTVCYYPSQQGFLINERNGNDAFKVAAITSLTVGNTVNTLGTLTNVVTGNWGAVGPAFVSRVMSRRTGSDVNLRAKQDIGSQTVAGVFISFASLGITPGTRIYGLSVFPNDVTAAMNLITLADVPSNTNSGVNGGLDMMAGGGYFVQSNILPLQLESFKGAIQQNNIRLQWNTLVETHVSRYEIERALGTTRPFITIGTVNAGNNDYQFTDMNAKAANGNPFLYRLKMIDQDGRFTYSNVLSFRFASSTGISLYPSVISVEKVSIHLPLISTMRPVYGYCARHKWPVRPPPSAVPGWRPAIIL
jgi:hypothetical protein